ncbi:MAG TPA: helix-turn-helix transcriptional regulator [Pseudolabrys sp.]|nr:helix-turn-helix transcriptional regulator [Pseudolabrys sp.]
MNSHPAEADHLDTVFGAIADWVSRYRRHIAERNVFGGCAPEEVQQVAKELGLSASELRSLARKDPGSADNLQKMLLALDVDPDKLAKSDSAVMRDLQRLCMMCDHKRQCQRELAKGEATEHFHEFCPNAFTLDALLKRETLPFQH